MKSYYIALFIAIGVAIFSPQIDALALKNRSIKILLLIACGALALFSLVMIVGSLGKI